MINAIIIDDEEKSISVLKMLLEKYCPEVKVMAEADEVNKAAQLIEKLQPNLIFLDIEMGGKTGFDLLEKIKSRNFHVIFVTAYSHFAVKAFRFSVVDYLIKPLDIDELKEAVLKVKRILEASPSQGGNQDSASRHSIRIPSTHGVLFVYEINIVRLEADGAYTRIFLDDGNNYISSYNLKQFEEQLDPALFMRVHRSHVINLKRIKSVVSNNGLTFARMEDGSSIEVSRRSKADFHGKIHQKAD